MDTQYQALLNVEGTGADRQDLVDQQIHCWLAGKGYAADSIAPTGRTDLGPSAWVSRVKQGGGDSANSKFELVERNANTGTWTVTLTSHFPAHEAGWVLAEVENSGGDGEASAGGKWAAAPPGRPLPAGLP